MDIIVKSKNCDVPSRVKDEAVEKLEHATRFFDRLIAIEMVFSAETNPRIAEPAVVEVTARTKGHHIRAEGSGEDHRGAIDVAVAKFERQLARYKARLVDRHRGRGRAPGLAGNGQVAAMPSESTGEDLTAAITFGRRKTHTLTAMLPDEAALQLELLGHDFYLFRNSGTDRCSVVYRRRQGDFGLIEAAD